MSEVILRLSKTQRLRSPADFRRVYQSKQYGGSSHHTFNVLSSRQTSSAVAQTDCETTSSRLGVTVSKKVSKKAVVRNRLRRQIKEFFRAHQHDLEGADLVITARPSCANASQPEQIKSLTVLWQKILKWQRWHRATRSETKKNSHGALKTEAAKPK